MSRLSRALSAVLLASAATAVQAAPTSYVFETVTKFDFTPTMVVVTGVLRNDTTPTTVQIPEQVTNYVYLGSRCVPVLLTMIEKPGRYYLNITAETAGLGMQNCGLELR